MEPWFPWFYVFPTKSEGKTQHNVDFRTLHKGSQSHPIAPTKVPYWVPGSRERVKNRIRNIIEIQDCLFLLVIISTCHCRCLILSFCIGSSRELPSWISGNITFLSALPLGRGPTTKQVHPGWLAGRDWFVNTKNKDIEKKF